MAITRRSLLFGAAGAAGAATLLAACSPGPGEGSTAGDSGDSGDAGGEISVILPGIGEDPAQKAVYEGLVAKFEEANPGIVVTTDHVNWAKLNEKLTASIAAGITPDVIMTGVGWVEHYADRGIYAELESSMFEKTDYTEGVLQPCSYQGGVYALPMYMDTRGMIGNRRLWDEAGIAEAPQTFDEFRAVARELTGGTGSSKRWGVIINGVGSPLQILATAVGANNARMFSDDGSTSLLNTPECVEAMEFLAGLVSDGSTTWDLRPAEGSPHPFLTQDIGMSIFQDSHWRSWGEANPDLVSEEGSILFRWANVRESAFLGGTLASRSATSQHPEAANKFLEFITGADQLLPIAEARDAVPPMQSVIERSPALQENRFVSFGVDGLPYSASEGGTPTYLEIRSQVVPLIEEAFIGRRTAEDVMNEAHRVAQEIIDRDS